MTLTRIVTLTAVLIGCAGYANAQAVRLEFHDGRVTLIAQNAPLRAILDEWARLGGTQVVNADRLSGAPVSLQLNAVPETQALEIILRGTAGYIAGLRADAAAGTSRSSLDRILIVPTAGTASAIANRPAAPPPFATPPAFAARPPQPVMQPEPDPDDDPVSDVAPDDDPPARGPVRVGPAINVPRNGPVVISSEPDQDPDNTAAPANAPAPANPFGIQTGSSRPGTISPVPPPQQQRPSAQPDPEP